MGLWSCFSTSASWRNLGVDDDDDDDDDVDTPLALEISFTAIVGEVESSSVTSLVRDLVEDEERRPAKPEVSTSALLLLLRDTRHFFVAVRASS